jgi:hypothetical protein
MFLSHMPNFRPAFVPGGCFVFTVNLLEMSFVRRIGAEGAIRRNVWQDGGLRLRLQPALVNSIRVTRYSRGRQRGLHFSFNYR